jgi:hypothetical protein
LTKEGRKYITKSKELTHFNVNHHQQLTMPKKKIKKSSKGKEIQASEAQSPPPVDTERMLPRALQGKDGEGEPSIYRIVAHG